jgi:DNA (cytosine-5)-methyltransferase 3A
MNKIKKYNALSLFDGMGCLGIALKDLGVEFNYFTSEIDKHAIAQSKLNFPDSTQLGDVTKWKEWDIDWSKIDIIGSGSPCFVAGTKVFTSKGHKSIEDIAVGDYVLTHTGKYQKVLRVGGKKNESIFTLKAQGVLITETTKGHPYYIRTMGRIWDNKQRTSKRVFADPKWKPASEISKGDFIGIPIIKKEENIYGLTKEECFILGRYIADGHTRKDYRKSENRPNDRHWQLILSIGNGKALHTSIPHSFYKHTQSVYRMVFSSKRLVQIAEEECGSGAYNKKIGANLLNLPIELLKQVLDGIISGDGSVKDGKIRISTTSPELIQTISLAITKCYSVGYSVQFMPKPKKYIIQGREVNQSDCYEIAFKKESTKQAKYFISDDFIWMPIRSVEKQDYKKDVYNLEVQNDNSYTANNAVVHNCQGFSFAGKQLAFDDPRSALFFVFVEILEHTKKLNPNVIFLLENVKMKKEHELVITKYMGVAPIEINAALVSAQNRRRLFWTNIKNEPYGLFGDMQCTIPQPKDRGILLKDILEADVPEKYYLSEKMLKYFSSRAANFNQGKVNIREEEGKVSTITASMASCDISDNFIKVDTNLNKANNQDKANCFTAGGNSGGLHSDMTLIAASRGRDAVLTPKRTEYGKKVRKDYENRKIKEQRKNIQQLEPRTDGKTNCITSVQKDNLVIQLNPSKESGGKQPYQQNRVYDTNGKNPALCSGQEQWGGNAILIPEATKKGYTEVNPGECFDLTLPTSETRRGRLMENKSNCLTAAKFDFMQYTQDFKIRRLTPTECARLQSIPDWYKWNCSDTSIYKMCGNGWNVEVIKHILQHANLQTKPATKETKLFYQIKEIY